MLLRRLRSRGRVAQLYYGADSQFAASGSPQQGACCSIISAVTTEYRGCLNRYVTCVTFVVVSVCFTLLVFSCTSAVSTAGHQLFTAQLIFSPPRANTKHKTYDSKYDLRVLQIVNSAD